MTSVKKTIESRRLILASGSPRRRALMAEWGYDFEVSVPPLSEPVLAQGSRVSVSAWAEALAYFKARSISERCSDAVVIGADTVVDHGGVLIGKPVDEGDARRILTEHFSGENRVITGLAVLRPGMGGRVITHVSTSIMMRAMSESELEDYLASGAWRDKAGAYALQEGGDRFVEWMEGSESNVVGLPMEALGAILSKF